METAFIQLPKATVIKRIPYLLNNERLTPDHVFEQENIVVAHYTNWIGKKKYVQLIFSEQNPGSTKISILASRTTIFADHDNLALKKIEDLVRNYIYMHY